MATVDASACHRVAASVRIDPLTDATAGDAWPVVAGTVATFA